MASNLIAMASTVRSVLQEVSLSSGQIDPAPFDQARRSTGHRDDTRGEERHRASRWTAPGGESTRWRNQNFAERGEERGATGLY